MQTAPVAELLERIEVPKPPPKKRKKVGRQASSVRRAIDDVLDRFVNNKAGDWKGAKPSTLLGLYAHLHTGIYGVAPEELADDWYPALSSAKRFLERSFGGDVEAAVACIRWSWQRVRRRRQPDDDFRMGWRYQFSQRLITDYKVAKNGR